MWDKVKQCETQLFTIKSSQLKQNNIFSYVKRNNNSEGVDGNEQCSSNVKEVPNPKRTRCNSTAKVRKWDDTHLRYVFFLRNLECSRNARTIPEMQEHSRNARTTEPLHLLIFNFCNNCIFVEVSNKELLDFLTSNSCFQIFVNGGSMKNATVYQGFHDDKQSRF